MSPPISLEHSRSVRSVRAGLLDSFLSSIGLSSAQAGTAPLLKAAGGGSGSSATFYAVGVPAPLRDFLQSGRLPFNLFVFGSVHRKLSGAE